MFWNLKKFENEISLLKSLGKKSTLHPLRKAQIKHTLLADLNMQPKQDAQILDSRYLPDKPANIWRYALASFLAFVFIGGTAFASQNSLPGDILYPVKIAQEKVVLNLSFSSENKARLQSKFAEKRLEELTKLRKKFTKNPVSNIKATSTAISEKEAEAKNNLQNAIQTLTEVQVTLEAKGNTKAASSVNETLLRLQGKHEGGVEVEIKMPRFFASTTPAAVQNRHAEVHVKIEDESKDSEDERRENEQDVKGANIETKIFIDKGRVLENRDQIRKNNRVEKEDN